MALLTKSETHDYNADIAVAKGKLVDLLDAMEKADPADGGFFGEVRAANAAFATSSAKVMAMYQAGDYEEAQRIRIAEEHKQSHVLEGQLVPFIA